jgi:hypothetical protein
MAWRTVLMGECLAVISQVLSENSYQQAAFSQDEGLAQVIQFLGCARRTMPFLKTAEATGPAKR